MTGTGFFGAFFLPFDSLRLSRPLAMFSLLSVAQPGNPIRPWPHFTWVATAWAA